MRQRLLLASVLSLGLPTITGAWEHTQERGIDLYQTGGAEAKISLVCDPRSVFGTTESAVLVQVGGNPDLSGPIQLEFPDGNRVDAELVHGRFGKSIADPAEWQIVLEGLRAHQFMTVKIDLGTAEVDLGEPMPFTCT